MMNLISKLKLVFDTIESFFKVLDFIIEYVKKYFDNKKNLALWTRNSDGSQIFRTKLKTCHYNSLPFKRSTSERAPPLIFILE